MKNLICQTCGSNQFKEEKNIYICEYCGAIIPKVKYSTKKIVFIIVLLIIIIIGIFIGYKLLYSVKQDIVIIKDTVKSNIKDDLKNYVIKESENNLEISYKEKTPYDDVILRVETQYGNRNGNSILENSLLEYQKARTNKAYYLALDAEGNYAYGFASGASSISLAEEKAEKLCVKEQKRRKVNAECIPYATNNSISRLIIE